MALKLRNASKASTNVAFTFDFASDRVDEMDVKCLGVPESRTSPRRLSVRCLTYPLVQSLPTQTPHDSFPLNAPRALSPSERHYLHSLALERFLNNLRAPLEHDSLIRRIRHPIEFPSMPTQESLQDILRNLFLCDDLALNSLLKCPNHKRQ